MWASILFFTNNGHCTSCQYFPFHCFRYQKSVKCGLSYACMPQNKPQMLLSVDQIGSTSLISNFSPVEYNPQSLRNRSSPSSKNKNSSLWHPTSLDKQSVSAVVRMAEQKHQKQNRGKPSRLMHALHTAPIPKHLQTIDRSNRQTPADTFSFPAKQPVVLDLAQVREPPTRIAFQWRAARSFF